MSFIKSILAFILALTIAGFCILNTQIVDITWSPLHDPYPLPLYSLIAGGLLLGFLIGASAVWINSATLRKTKRQQKKQIKTLEKELSKSATPPHNLQNPPKDFFPALPHKKSGNA